MRHCNKWKQKFEGYGFRLTVPREAILEVLINTDKHLSAEDIYLAVHLDNPAIGLTTIYRTLELLVQGDIVSKFEFGHGRAKYELAEQHSNKKHHQSSFDLQKMQKNSGLFRFYQGRTGIYQKSRDWFAK